MGGRRDGLDLDFGFARFILVALRDDSRGTFGAGRLRIFRERVGCSRSCAGAIR